MSHGVPTCDATVCPAAELLDLLQQITDAPVSRVLETFTQTFAFPRVGPGC